ncbi:MAG TPA: helix-turn-helix domain-containing protein [Pirellulales bacterium]|nr:helix-turn-helix domain-containing protein [Pirellulales bacterium]
MTAAAEKFHVATNHVRMACAEHGAQPRVAQPTSNVRMLQIVADIARGKSRKQICDERCLSRERVRQIKDKAEAAGSIKSHFAAALRRCRKANGLTQADAAAIAGIGQTHWSAYESGSSTNPSLDHIIAMAAALGVKVSELLDSPPAPDATAMLRHEREIDPKRNQNA